MSAIPAPMGDPAALDLSVERYAATTLALEAAAAQMERALRDSEDGSDRAGVITSYSIHYTKLYDIKPGREVGQAYAFLLELRMERGPLGEDAAREELLAWWAAR